MYTSNQIPRLTGQSRVDAYQTALSILTKNFARYPYDARTALYLAHILSLAPDEVTADGTSTWGRLKDIQAEVIAHKPDLVTIEFVNDMGMDRKTVFEHYNSAIDQIRAAGAEVILLTPHFVMPMWMPGHKTGWEPETRPTVGFLREFAKEKGICLADTSKRWEHLSIEGIPYVTLEFNGINHPDDRGHQMFVDELMRPF